MSTTAQGWRFLTRDEEGVVLVSCWVLLGLEQRIEVPEGALDEVIGGHFRESVNERHNTKEYACRLMIQDQNTGMEYNVLYEGTIGS